GVDNRRAFDETLDHEWKRAIRDAQPLTLIMIDIDSFKAYNDYFGHQAGDDCLVKVARTLVATLRRPADRVARYGGEEFAIILPSTERAGAAQIAEMLRAN